MKIGINARSLVNGLTGIGRYVYEMCWHLSASGHDLILYFPEPPKTKLTQLPNAHFRVGGARGRFSHVLWGELVLPRLVAKDGVDVFWGPDHRLPLFLGSSIPCVLTIHDLVWLNAASTMRLRGWLAESVFTARSIRKADELVVDSNATCEALKAAFPKAVDKLNLVYPGLTMIGRVCSQTPSTSVRNDYNINGPYALFVGTLEPRKNLMRLLHAYALLPAETMQACCLVIVGGAGWGQPDLRNLIAELGIGQFVRLTGYVSDNQLADLYVNARLLVLPSLYEGFGFPIIEANAVGVPVLTSNLSSMPEVAGKAALLTNPYDVVGMADAIKKLVHDDDLHRSLAVEARSNAARFNWYKSAEKLTLVFEKAILKRRDHRKM